MSTNKRDRSGTVIGLVTFLFGVGLIVTTFLLAKDLFSVSPDEMLRIKPGTALDLNSVASSGFALLAKIILLVLMSAIGSVVASRGIKLYVQAGTVAESPEEKKES